VVVVTLAVSFAAGVPAAVASFIDNGTASSTFTAAPDWVAPQASASVIAKATGYLAGAIKQGGTYYVYANVTDSGSPPSGIATETADASSTTSGASNTTLTAGSWSVNGVTYNYRSALLTAANPLSAGSKSFSVTSTDVAGNNRVQTGYTVTVDNTAPTATDVQTTNVGGGTAGKAQLGDTITFTFSEQIDPQSILSGWTGASTSVVVRLIDGGCTLVLCSDDSFQIWNAANTSQLPFGTVDLNRIDYNGDGIGLGTESTITFGASGTASTMVQSGSSITITLGTASATANTAGGNGTMAWDSTTTPYDAAGNVATGNNPNEGGGNDKEF
jgi:hypothetical protein